MITVKEGKVYWNGKNDRVHRVPGGPVRTLTWEQVCEIRRLYDDRAENGCTTRSLGLQFNCPHSHVVMIVNRKSRKWR